MAHDLRRLTLSYFDSVNFSELNDQWIDQVIASEFTDVEDNKITLNILFVNDGITTLNKLSEICYAWCEKTSEEDNVTVEEGVLWIILNEIDVTVKHILGFVYLLCDRANKRGQSFEEKAFGVAAAKLYFICLRIPGSSAYSVYHSNLFCLCFDCISVPDFTVEKDNSAMRELERLSALYLSTLTSIIPLLKEFYLGNEEITIKHVVKKLAELCACELHDHINFDINLLELEEKELRRRYKISFIISSLAYRAFLSLLETDLNGDKIHNYTLILFQLKDLIICSKAKKSSTISQKHLLVRDNAVRFICHNLKTRDFTPIVVQKLLQWLCINDACEKADFRTIISETIVHIVLQMKNENIADAIHWFLKLVDSQEAKQRLIALDILNFLLKSIYGEDSDTDTVPKSLKPYLTQTPIIFAILTRCDDFSPVVRKKALNVLSDNVECIFDFLESTRAIGTFQFEELEGVVESNLDVNGNHRFFWYNLETFQKRLNEIASMLRERVKDYNCVTRVAALLALGNLVILHMDFLTEENLKLFYEAMKDDNIIVRKQMIESLTGILNTYRTNSVAQKSWLKCILPLVQDPETSVHMKAMYVLEERFLLNIYSDNQDERECSFSLLKKICTDFLSYQRYFQKAFHQWKSYKKLRGTNLLQLEKYIETEWEECVWFLISNFATYCSLPNAICNMTMEHFEKFQVSGSYRPSIIHMLKVLKLVIANFSPEKLKIVHR